MTTATVTTTAMATANLNNYRGDSFVAAVVMAKVVMAAIIMVISVCPHLLPRFRLIVFR
jgi:hypothetical protein